MILLNGPSSAGKTSIAKALQQLLLDRGTDAVILSLDDYLQMSAKGYGIRLMDCIEKHFPWAAAFDLDTPCWNERTNAFYKKLGYRIIKIEDGFVFYRKRKSEPNIGIC